MQKLSCVPQNVAVHTEHDVIMLRQTVRAMARSLGLGLVQQARLATAISAIARALIEECDGTYFMLQATNSGPQPAMEISCVPTILQKFANLVELERTLHVGDACSLVDEASLSTTGEDAILMLRMWTGR